MTNLLNILIVVLIAVESSGNNRAIGDNGLAVGCLQIHPIMVQDANRISGKHYTLLDRYNRRKSVQMCQIYLRHYCTAKRLGHKPTMQDCARCWCSGPMGYRKKCSLPYWFKVKKRIKALTGESK